MTFAPAAVGRSIRDAVCAVPNQKKPNHKERAAVSQAEQDLEAAFLQKHSSGSDHDVGEYLRDKGYVSVTDFKIVPK